jgi:hypothetical protein
VNLFGKKTEFAIPSMKRILNVVKAYYIELFSRFGFAAFAATALQHTVLILYVRVCDCI